jgi:hypothetical protein
MHYYHREASVCGYQDIFATNWRQYEFLIFVSHGTLERDRLHYVTRTVASKHLRVVHITMRSTAPGSYTDQDESSPHPLNPFV